MSRSPEYERHLKSEYWRAVRRMALEQAGHRCQVCKNGESLDVHHNNYKNLGKETLRDVIVLCRDCHDHHHQGEEQLPLLIDDLLRDFLVGSQVRAGELVWE